MGSDILSPRDSGILIAHNSRNVKINAQAVKDTALLVANSFYSGETTFQSYKEHPLHPKIANEDAVDFIFVADTLNFSFWPDVPGQKFEVLYNNEFYTGYWSLVATILRAKDEGKQICNSTFMENMELNEFKYIFRSDSEFQIPLINERLKAFNEGGKILNKKFGGSFVNCIKSCNKDALELLNLIVTNFSSYQDTSVFDDKKVAFFKRAQILIADIWLCFEGKGIGEFSNINMLTMFADYRVPQTLEYFKILEYSPQLKQVLENETVLEPGNRYELEIRGCSIEAVEQLKTETCGTLLNKRVENGQKKTDDLIAIVNSITVDNYLWDYARAHRKEMAHLHFHKVRTIYY